MIRELQQIGRNFQNRFHPISKFVARSTEEISRNLMFPFLMFEFLCAPHICVIKRLQVQFGIHKRKEILCSIRESSHRISGFFEIDVLSANQHAAMFTMDTVNQIRVLLAGFRFYETVIKSNGRERYRCLIHSHFSKAGQPLKYDKQWHIPSSKSSLLTRYVVCCVTGPFVPKIALKFACVNGPVIG